MVAKISVGNSLYGAIAYNGEKINEAQGRLLTTNRIYNDGSGKVDINKAMEGFLTFMPPQMKVEKPVVHISLNPHPEDVLTDAELQDIAREYLEKLGFGNQPYLVFKHEDIDRHHLHIVTVRVDDNGKCISDKNNYYRSKQITRELEKKYGLHGAERRNRRLDTPLSKVDASAGDVKKQVAGTVKALNGQYRFQTMGEYRALLSLYNMTVEEARGNVRGREYHGLVYSVTDDKGNKVGNPFKSSLFGKSAGYEAVQRKFIRSKSEIKDRKLADMTKRTVLSVLQGTYDKDKFVETDHILPGHHDFLGQEVGKVKDVVDELAFYRIELPFLMAGRDEHADFIFRVDHVDFIGHIEILPPQDDLAEPVAAGNKAITETAAPIEKVAHPFETFFRTLETYGLRYELAKDPEAETDGKDQANVDDNRRPARHDLPQEGLQMIQDIGDNRAGGHAGSDHANLGRT